MNRSGSVSRLPRWLALCGLLAIAVFSYTSVATAAAVAGRASSEPGSDSVSAQVPLDPQALPFEEILFVKRKPYSSDHYYTDINSGTSPDRFLPENGIYIYNLRARSERPVVTAANLPGGKGF